MATVKATVAVVVNRAVTDVILVHHIHHAHYCLGVVCSVTVNLYIEDVATACEVMIRSLNLGLMARTALEVYRYVVAVCIVVTVGNTLDDTVTLAVAACETAREALGWSSKDTIVVLVLLGEVVCTVTHVSDDAQTEFLCLLALTVMLAHKCNKTLGKTDETDTQCTLVDYRRNCVVRLQFLATEPQ